MTNRILRFLHERSTKQAEEYEKFYKDYGLFLKEGIVTAESATEKVKFFECVLVIICYNAKFQSYYQEEIAKLLLFDSSRCAEGKRVSLPEYCNTMKEDQKDIYYIAAPRYVIIILNAIKFLGDENNVWIIGNQNHI